MSLAANSERVTWTPEGVHSTPANGVAGKGNCEPESDQDSRPDCEFKGNSRERSVSNTVRCGQLCPDCGHCRMSDGFFRNCKGRRREGHSSCTSAVRGVQALPIRTGNNERCLNS